METIVLLGPRTPLPRDSSVERWLSAALRQTQLSQTSSMLVEFDEGNETAVRSPARRRPNRFIKPVERSGALRSGSWPSSSTVSLPDSCHSV